MFRKVFVSLIFLLWGVSVNAAVSTLVADTKSGFILKSDNATEQKPPASLTKLMTLYLTFGALESGVLSWDDQLPVSERAAAQPKSKIGVAAGETISVRDAVSALIIKSANDVAVVVAEALGQDEEHFADLMTRTAKGLGLSDTVFKNASGLHEEGQVTTAKDMAILTMALIAHYPEYYKLFAMPSFTYKGQTYHSHNTVLQQYEGAEGLKTGFVSAVGYNIISTARKGDSRLMSIVIGETSPTKRDLRAMRLLDKGFHQVDIQRRAEADGRLKSAFNPLNRRAFISKPPVGVFVPLMRMSWRQSQKKMAHLSKKKRAPIPVVVADTGVEQGDNWSIQVGAFEGEQKARQTAEKAIDILGANGKEIKTPQANNRFFRSRIQGFSEREAQQACQRLLKGTGWQCFPVAPKG
ncbi:MAG: D-alanyl-D-alanine carboxypeptidase [Alphaproteobacteria bacterium]|nr:D-alanyl-D-alanine carboxypeptidase [Alphaproteobacteria bacterium]